MAGTGTVTGNVTLNANGIASDQIPSKIEGISFGQDVDVNGTLMHTLWVANDNDFTPADSGPNDFFVFGFTDAACASTRFWRSARPETTSRSCSPTDASR